MRNISFVKFINSYKSASGANPNLKHISNCVSNSEAEPKALLRNLNVSFP